MNILQRAAAKLLPEEWFAPAESDRIYATRIGHDLTVREINSCLELARIGDTRLLSSLKNEMRSTDGDLESHVGKLEGMLTQAPLELMRWPPAPPVKSATPTPDEVESEEVTAYCKEQLLDPDLDLGAAITHTLWGQMDGLAGFQMIVKPDGKKRFKLLRLDPVPSERFHWLVGTTTLVVQPGENTGELIPVDQMGYSCPVMVSDPQVTLRDRSGLLRRCITPWYTKLYGFEGWSKNVELTGIPFRKVKYKGNWDETKLKKLEAQVRAMGTRGVGLFPDTVDLDWIAQAVGNKSAHEGLVVYCDHEKAKVLLGATQTSDVQSGSGSQSSAEVHERALEMKAAWYGIRSCSFLRQVLKTLVTLSFGADVAERSTPLPFLRVRSYADLLKMAQAVLTFGQAGIDSIPYSWFHSQTGIPIPVEGERVIVFPKGTAPAPALPGLPGLPGEPGAKPPSAAPGEPGQPEGASRQAGSSSRSPAAALTALEREAVAKLAGSGDSVVAPYVTLIDETRRDGGDLGHLLSRVRLQAQMRGRDAQQTRDILAMISAKALLTGFVQER